ncbi:MAG: HAD-IIB family hydrolase [Oscillospiraceae bacterium]|nr:HAD-IIB family hydrolase [Oscillospiraceae bacterium]
MDRSTLYVSDLDGTLLQNDATLSPYAREELNRMMDEGMNFTLSSARSTGTIIDILKGLKLRLPCALFNGVLYYDYAESRFVRIMEIEKEAAVAVAKVMEKFDLHHTMYIFKDPILHACYTQLDSERDRSFVEHRSHSPHKKWIQVDSFVALAETEKAVFFSMPGPKEKMDEVYAEMEKIPGISLTYYLDTYEPVYYLEIQAEGVDKKLSIEMLREMTGCEKVVAFGDNHNDLAMAQAADKFVAVANAKPEVLSQADEVVPSNVEEGVIQYLQKRYPKK